MGIPPAPKPEGGEEGGGEDGGGLGDLGGEGGARFASEMKKESKGNKALQKKKPYFYASAVSILLCLLVFYWVVSKKRDYDKKCVDEVQAEVQKLEEISAEVRAAGNNLQGVLGEYNKVKEMTEKRSQWLNILNELQTILPDKWWLTSLTAHGAKQVKAKLKSSSGGNGKMPGNESMFGDPGVGAASSTTQIKNVDLNWLKLEGHSVALRSDLLLSEVFKENIKKSKYFDYDSIVFDSYNIMQGENNFITFEIQIRLKNPIKK